MRGSMIFIRSALGIALAIGVLCGRAPAADWPGPAPAPKEAPPTPPFTTPETPDDTTPPVVTPPTDTPTTDHPTTGTGQPPSSDGGPVGPPITQNSPEPATLGMAIVGVGALLVRRKRS